MNVCPLLGESNVASTLGQTWAPTGGQLGEERPTPGAGATDGPETGWTDPHVSYPPDPNA
jgi:hypothetical protein